MPFSEWKLIHYMYLHTYLDLGVSNCDTLNWGCQFSWAWRVYKPHTKWGNFPFFYVNDSPTSWIPSGGHSNPHATTYGLRMTISTPASVSLLRTSWLFLEPLPIRGLGSAPWGFGLKTYNSPHPQGCYNIYIRHFVSVIKGISSWVI